MNDESHSTAPDTLSAPPRRGEAQALPLAQEAEKQSDPVKRFTWLVLAHGLFPDPPGALALPPRPGALKGYVPVAASAALKSTLVVLPIAVLFIPMEWTGEILTMVFAAMFSLSPQISKGRVAALNSLKSTFNGGLSALVFYGLIVAALSVLDRFFFATRATSEP